MHRSAKTHYACLAMLELARRHDEGDAPVAVREITARHGISQPFLVQILQQLKAAGLVQSTRGSQGGYRLNCRPDEITLLDVVDAVDAISGGEPTTADDVADEARVLQRAWRDADDAWRAALARTRLGDLARQCARPQEPMFYI